MRSKISDKKSFTSELLQHLKSRATSLGESETQFAARVGSSPALFKNLRKGSLPTADRLDSLLKEIGETLALGRQDKLDSQLPPTASNGTTPPSSFKWGMNAPHHGFATCSVQGWGKDQPDLPALPLPSFINDPRAFYVTARGSSMRPEGIQEGDHCLVTPAQDICEGDRIWIKDKGGSTSIKRLEKMTGKSLKLRGWMPPEDGKQQSFDEERLSNYVDQAYPIAAVFRGPPGTDRARFIPDPKHISFPFAGPAVAGDYGVIALHDVQAAAGTGRLNWTEQVISSLAFPMPWLTANGISPDHASLIYVAGASMEPTLKDGSVVMINHNRTAIRGRRIYAFLQGGELRVKRLEQLPAGQVLVLSDNGTYSSEIIKESNGYDFQVIGEVVWSAGKIEQKGI
ncbi:helix-turn-helix transcriptional regulator [Thalassovita sp.]|uniref:S24 family peptidase n=1 Tax=Thalassovita sp. TaxID=1979401 RepID=UPI0028815F52|nr:S24 family peptidase [Thalassovita sp.]MDF1803658.1 S24 family peptidase [Thalassovita sp.]